MTLKLLWLFLIVCMVDGPLIIAGSIAGAAFRGKGLFIGAILGGLLGVFVAARIALRIKTIPPQDFRRTVIGGVAGFILAALIATSNLRTPVIPALSGLLIGAGAVIGSVSNRRKP